MIRNAALLGIILLAAPVVAAAEPPNPMATPAPTPGPKINTEVAPRILLRTPKPVACLGAKSTDFLLSSCSGAPGTHLTLTTTLEKNVSSAKVLFKQNAPSKGNYTAQVGRSAGAYTLTVPPLCNGGSPSFSLVASYISLVPGRGSVSENLGNFTAICGQTAQATASPKPTSAPTPEGQPQSGHCTGALDLPFLVSSCSGAPGTQVTLTRGPMNMVNPRLASTFYGGPFGSFWSDVRSSGPNTTTYTFIVPPYPCTGGSNILVYLAFGYTGTDGIIREYYRFGNFTVICGQPAATASPKPTPTASPKPKPTASHHDN